MYKLIISWNRFPPGWTRVITVGNLRACYQRFYNRNYDISENKPEGPAHALLIYIDNREKQSVYFYKSIPKAELAEGQPSIKDPLAYSRKGHCMVLQEYRTPLIALAEANNDYFFDTGTSIPSDRFGVDIKEFFRKTFKDKTGQDFNVEFIEAPYKRTDDSSEDCAISVKHMAEKVLTVGYWPPILLPNEKKEIRNTLATFCKKNFIIHLDIYGKYDKPKKTKATKHHGKKNNKK